ncbi:MAG TPA: VTT domain-containing protein [Acidocella sp.]|jgi:uncharacterized membrane protein YdjX (TVP38/TMEM64 family)|nr:VTT domain-containing protein [Acidocella sp.]
MTGYFRVRPSFLLLLLAVLGVLLLAAGVVAGPHLITLVMDETHRPRDAGPVGLALFAAMFFLAALAGVIPGGPLGLAAGAIFGLEAGFTASAIGSMAGAAAAFGLSRSWLRPSIATLLARHNKLARLDTAFGEQDWRLVALLRVSPVMPFSLTSYALGLSGIGFPAYLLGTLGSLPTLSAYVALGALGAYGANLPSGTGRAIHLGLAVLGGAASLLLILYLGRMLGRVLRPA